MDLLAALRRYKPLDSADLTQAQAIIEFVQNNPRCFERGFAAGHITGSAWLVDPSGTQVLLTHHKKLQKWLQLGGHADGNPDVLAVAVREAEEESGLTHLRVVSPDIFDVDVHPIPERGEEAAHFHYDIRFALQAPRMDFTVSSESHDLAWMNIKELHKISQEESLLRMSRKWHSLSPL